MPPLYKYTLPQCDQAKLIFSFLMWESGIQQGKN